jgi:hypothetical protein
MSRQQRQVEIEYRVGPGEADGRRGLRAHRQNVDPTVAVWFNKVVTDPSFPIDPRVGSFHIYIDGELASSIVAQDLPPVAVPPGDLARAEQLRGEAAKAEARVSQLSAQVSVDEHRLRSLQAEIVACEGRLVVERERVVATARACDEEILELRKQHALERAQMSKDLQMYREDMLTTRKDIALLFEHLRTGEVEDARHHSKRRQQRVEQLTQVNDDCNDLEAAAMRAAVAGNTRPGFPEQLGRLGFTADNVLKIGLELLNAAKGQPKAEG